MNKYLDETSAGDIHEDEIEYSFQFLYNHSAGFHLNFKNEKGDDVNEEDLKISVKFLLSMDETWDRLIQDKDITDDEYAKFYDKVFITLKDAV